MELAQTGYHIHSAAFEPRRAAQYELSILAGMDSFAYTIRDQEHNRLLAYASHRLPPTERGNPTSTLTRLMAEEPYLGTGNYGTVLLGWETEKLTIVPRELYVGEEKREYLQQLTPVTLDDLVEEVWYNELEAHLLYLAHEPTLTALRDRLRVTRVHHPAGGLLVAWGARSRRLQEASVSVAFRGTRLLVAVHRAGALRMVNTFSFLTKEDVLYYVLLAYEQEDLLPAEVPLYLSGEILPDSELFTWLHTYVGELRFSQYGAPPSPAPELATLPTHLYFDLLCLA